MNASEFMDKLCAFARTNLAAKCTNPVTMMAIGASTCGVGRRAAEKRIMPILAVAADDAGNIDVDGVKESLTGGMELAKAVPVLGGLFSVDQSDIDAFFTSIGH